MNNEMNQKKLICILKLKKLSEKTNTQKISSETKNFVLVINSHA